MAIVRYLVTDVERSIAFYTKALGFKLDQSMAPAFARVSNDDLTRGSQDHRVLRPGTCLTGGFRSSVVESLRRRDRGSGVAGRGKKRVGLTFRNEVVVGPGGKQILLEDPDGNVVELFEPAR